MKKRKNYKKISERLKKKIEKLETELDWYRNFGSTVMDLDSNVHDEAIEIVDEMYNL